MPEPERRGLMADLRAAVPLRTVGLLCGVLLIQLAFIASYVGAFHSPKPHQVSFGVTSSVPTVAEQTADRLEKAWPQALLVRRVPDPATAVRLVKRGDLSAALAVNPGSTRDDLLVATGGGAALETVVEQGVGRAEAQLGRSVVTTDVVPLQQGDARGLTGFYLTVGWLVGGYLFASLLGVAQGSRPASTRRAGFRIAAALPYAVVSGAAGAAIVGPVLGALTGHFWALTGLGVLLVLSSATVTMALQALFGTLGIGLTVLLFVVLGNPSAGGPYQAELLPPFWRLLGSALPNGAGTDAVRKIVYFEGMGATGNVALLLCYAMAGALAAPAATAALRRRDSAAAGTTSAS